MFLILINSSPLIINIVVMVAMFAVMYFFFIQPQSKRQNEQTNFINNLKVGDKVVTSGGIIGKIRDIQPDSVVMEAEIGTKFRVLKSALSAEFTKNLKE